METKNKKIGYWSEKKKPQNYVLSKFIKRLEKIEAKITANVIVKHIHYKGNSVCRICAEDLGSTEYKLGNLIWPEGYIHYLKEHNVCPPLSFIRFISSKFKA